MTQRTRQMPDSAETLFDRANRLWYDEGYTGRAAETYRRSLEANPENPVLGYQLAHVSWLLGRPERAREHLRTAERGRTRLNFLGVQTVDQLRQRIEAEAPKTPYSETQYPLDVERLESMDLSPSAWRTVATDARQRGLYGVAVHAYDRGQHSFVDIDSVEEREEAAFDAHLERSVLEDMWKNLKRDSSG